MTSDGTVFVVDDDPRMRESLRWLLESVHLQVETYESAVQFLDAYDERRPGCLVLDIRMPEMSGLQLQELLAAKGIQLPIIMITGYGNVSTAVHAVRSGAVDFLEKPFNDQVLLDRIFSALELDARRRQVDSDRDTIQRRLSTLTPREHEVLLRVLAGEQNKTIAANLDISMKTVEVHRAHIMQKLAVASLAGLVATCLAAGLRTGKP